MDQTEDMSIYDGLVAEDLRLYKECLQNQEKLRKALAIEADKEEDIKFCSRYHKLYLKDIKSCVL